MVPSSTPSSANRAYSQMERVVSIWRVSLRCSRRRISRRDRSESSDDNHAAARDRGGRAGLVPMCASNARRVRPARARAPRPGPATMWSLLSSGMVRRHAAARVMTTRARLHWRTPLAHAPGRSGEVVGAMSRSRMSMRPRCEPTLHEWHPCAWNDAARRRSTSRATNQYRCAPHDEWVDRVVAVTRVAAGKVLAHDDGASGAPTELGQQGRCAT